MQRNKKNRRNSQGRKRQPQRLEFDRLEDRLLMAGNTMNNMGALPMPQQPIFQNNTPGPAGIYLNGTTLTIQGADTNDTAVIGTVGTDPGSPFVPQIQVTLHRSKSTAFGNMTVETVYAKYGINDIDKISFYGYEGNDSFTNNTAISSTAWGHGGWDLLIGGSGVDALYGGNDCDTLEGRGGDDYLAGGLHNDTYLFASLNDSLGYDTVHESANSDTDTLDFSQLTDGMGINLKLDTPIKQYIQKGSGGLELKLTNGTGIENVVGTDGGDWIMGNSRNNKISGLEGIDWIWGADGNDWIYGGKDGDILEGNSGADYLYGEQGDDTLHGNAGDDWLFGGTDGDTLHGDLGADHLYGEQGDDTLHGNAGDDWLFGGTDGDTLHGNSGADHLYGEQGEDKLYAHAGDDWLFGGTDDDILHGDSGADHLYGEQGDDNLYAHAGDDILYGGAGNDLLDAGDKTLPGYDQLFGGADQDTTVGERTDILDPGANDGDRRGILFSKYPNEKRYVYFENGNATTTTLNNQSLYVQAATWNNSEVDDVLATLDILTNLTNNLTLIATADGYDITFVRRGNISAGNWLGWNSGSEITILNNGMQKELLTTVHEIAHNWHDVLQNSFAPAFQAVGGWKKFSGEIPSGYEQAKSKESEWAQWGFVNKNDGYDGFARDYGKNNYHEDFATAFTAYVTNSLNINYWGQASVTYATRLQDRFAVIDQWISSISTTKVNDVKIVVEEWIKNFSAKEFADRSESSRGFQHRGGDVSQQRGEQRAWQPTSRPASAVTRQGQAEAHSIDLWVDETNYRGGQSDREARAAGADTLFAQEAIEGDLHDDRLLPEIFCPAEDEVAMERTISASGARARAPAGARYRS